MSEIPSLHPGADDSRSLVHDRAPASSTSGRGLRSLACALIVPWLVASAVHACDATNLPGCFLEVRNDLKTVLDSAGKNLGSNVGVVKTFTQTNSEVMASLRSALATLGSVTPGGSPSPQVLQRLTDNQKLLAFLAGNNDPDYRHFLGASCPDSYCSEFQAALVELLDNFAAATDQAGQLALAEVAASGADPLDFPTARAVGPITELVQSAPPALLFPLWKGLESVDVGPRVETGCSPDNTPCTVVKEISNMLFRVATELPTLTQLLRQTAREVRIRDLPGARDSGREDPASLLCGTILTFGPSNITIITTVVDAVGLLAGAIGAELIANQYFLSLTRANIGASVGIEGTAGLTFDPGKYLGWIGKGIQTIFSVTGSISDTVLTCRTLANQQLILCVQAGGAYSTCYDEVKQQTPGQILGF
jgi:hypothetical protein